MAKTSIKSEGSSLIEEIQSEINSQMGKLVAYNLEMDDPLKVKQWFSTGSDLIDLITRGDFGEGSQKGGIPSGRILMMNGESGAGKSLLAWHLVKDVVDKGGVALYIDTEGATNLSFPHMIGCDTSKVMFVPPEKCETVEEMFTIIDKFMMALMKSKNPDKFGIIVVDSFTQLSTEEEMNEEGVSSRQYPTKARLASKIMRKIKGVIPQTNICLCITNQLRTDINDTSFFGDKSTVPTGTAQWFSASTVLRIYKSSKVKGDSVGDIVGQVVRVKVEKSRFTRPQREVKIPLHFEYGMQNAISIYDKIDELKLFYGKTKAKKWINDWDGKEGAVQADKNELSKGASEWIFKFAAKDWSEIYDTNADVNSWAKQTLKDYFMRPTEKWNAGEDTLDTKITAEEMAKKLEEEKEQDVVLDVKETDEQEN